LDLSPDLQFAKLNYAHALMFTGDAAAAREIYLAGSKGAPDGAEWRTHIRSDFSELSAKKLTHPLMDEIIKEISKEQFW